MLHTRLPTSLHQWQTKSLWVFKGYEVFERFNETCKNGSLSKLLFHT